MHCPDTSLDYTRPHVSCDTSPDYARLHVSQSPLTPPHCTKCTIHIKLYLTQPRSVLAYKHKWSTYCFRFSKCYGREARFIVDDAAWLVTIHLQGGTSTSRRPFTVRAKMKNNFTWLTAHPKCYLYRIRHTTTAGYKCMLVINALLFKLFGYCLVTQLFLLCVLGSVEQRSGICYQCILEFYSDKTSHTQHYKTWDS